MPARVPGDVKDALFRAGKIPDPLVGLNSFAARWTEDRSWWYRRRFRIPATWHRAPVIELELDGLDVHADVFLDGALLGHHPSSFRPFRHNVKDRIRPGQTHELLVRLTSGLERVRMADIGTESAAATPEPEAGPNAHGDPRTMLLRKPMYSFGWDWAPRLATCGITGGARLRA